MEDFLKEVKEMTEDDILLALEEQADLYGEEEIKILNQELSKRGIKSSNIKTSPKVDIKEKEVTAKAEVSDNDGNFWTSFLKSITSISLIIWIIIGIAIGCMMGNAMGLITAIGIILLAMISVVSIMVFIEISENTYKTRKNSSEILRIIKKK